MENATPCCDLRPPEGETRAADLVCRHVSDGLSGERLRLGETLSREDFADAALIELQRGSDLVLAEALPPRSPHRAEMRDAQKVRRLPGGQVVFTPPSMVSPLRAQRIELVRPPLHHEYALVPGFGARIGAAHRVCVLMGKPRLDGIGVPQPAFVQEQRRRGAEAVRRRIILRRAELPLLRAVGMTIRLEPAAVQELDQPDRSFDFANGGIGERHLVGPPSTGLIKDQQTGQQNCWTWAIGARTRAADITSQLLETQRVSGRPRRSASREMVPRGGIEPPTP